jgi:hypothetical protein
MRQSNNPQFNLNLGMLDARARFFTFAANTSTLPDFAVRAFRAGAIRRYKGYLRDSMICGYRSWYAKADHRYRSMALGYLSPPSPRMKKLLNALPRLQTAPEPVPSTPEQDYFAFGGGWSSVYAPSPPPRPVPAAPTYPGWGRITRPTDVVGYFDWPTVVRQETRLTQAATDRYLAINAINRFAATINDKAVLPCPARRIREVEFYRSLERERGTLCDITTCMAEHEHELQLVGLAPDFDEWKYKTAKEALERARNERRWREAWAVQCPDTRPFVTQL